MRDLHRHRRAVDQHDLVRPVELIGLARRKAQRHIGFRRRRTTPDTPLLGVAPNRVVTALIAQPAQLLEDPDQRQPLACRLRLVIQQHPIKIDVPRPQLRPRLHHPDVLERGRSRTQNLAHRVPRHLQLAHDLLDRLASDKVLAPDPPDRLHNQHPPPPARIPKRISLHITAQRGSKLDADHPSTGVNLPRRNTLDKVSRKIREAQTVVDEEAGVRRRAMDRKLRSLEVLPEIEAATVLELDHVADF